MGAWWCVDAFQNPIDDFALAVATEQPLRSERLPEYDRSAEDIALTRYVAAPNLLRSHVSELALDFPFTRRLQAPPGFGDAEIDHARQTIDAHENVLR